MTTTQTGMAVGAVLAIVGVAFGPLAFVFVAVAIVIGALVGRFVDGRLDVDQLRGAFRGRSSS